MCYNLWRSTLDRELITCLKINRFPKKLINSQMWLCMEVAISMFAYTLQEMDFFHVLSIPRHSTNFYPTNNNSADTPCVYTTLSGQFFVHQSVQVFNLLRKCSSAEQIFVCYRVNPNRDECLHEFARMCFSFLFKCM